MIPLRDENTPRRKPVVTPLIIGLNVLVFIYQLSLGAEGNQVLVSAFGAVPANVTGVSLPRFPVAPALTVITAMFLHGGFAHLLGNMLFLWIFGDNVEDVMGRGRFLLFYLLTGVAAAAAHILMEPSSHIPMVGASGAISGVLGAYVLLFPRARVLTLLFLGFLVQVVRIRAVFFLAFWFLLQFLYGAMSAGAAGQGGVAWFAHVGGFLAGMLLVFPFSRRERLAWYRKVR